MPLGDPAYWPLSALPLVVSVREQPAFWVIYEQLLQLLKRREGIKVTHQPVFAVGQE